MDWREIYTKLRRLGRQDTPEGRAANAMAYHIRKKLPDHDLRKYNGKEWSRKEKIHINPEYLAMLCRDLNFYGMASNARWKEFSDHPLNCEMRLIE